MKRGGTLRGSGVAALVVLALGVTGVGVGAAWTFSRKASAQTAPHPRQVAGASRPAAPPQSTAEPASSDAAASGPTRRFRADAWFLPDEALLGFVEVPAGPFLMGSDPAVDTLAFDNELWAESGGAREVDLPAFLVGRYEVTVAQFQAFVEASGYRAREETLLGAPDHPVAAVSWPDALAYCRWLGSTLRAWPGTPPELSRRLAEGWRFTLPSEAEWEKAARGTDGRVYPWGNEPRRDRANFRGRSPTPVGTFACPECPFELADMSGNVWEWTRTPYRPGAYRADDGPPDLESDALWVMRGGSFGDDERTVRAAVRGGADPGVRRPVIGFRVVLTPP